MIITQYEAFLKTIELKSLTRAAEVLGYTQSGISHMLNALETSCGFKLLTRDRSGVRITSEGQQLFPYFQSVCNSHKILSEKINEMHRLESGLIRIGTFTSVSVQWLPSIIKKFRTDYPKIQFELLHGTNEEIEEWIIQGRVDCAFILLPSTKQLETIFLKRDPFVAVLPENHPHAKNAFFPISSLSKYPYIKIDERDDDKISEIFKIHQINPDVHFVEDDVYAIIAMVENGLGISILPELVLKNTSQKIISKELENPAYRDLAIAFKDKSLISDSAQKFLTYIQLWISEEYGLQTLSDNNL
ncbi:MULTISPECIES: LysR family transcriptional regulator [Peribacillus]|uniref:LysR family transcriptional regulator n=1 Tax=Peribacillus TaxID=2675229 RepID=UPI00177D3DBF|nr:LysR family transcriptional regulator [Brevibacillus sp. JNUCC-41]QOS88769.1 LysR family transcriptional regulator [Brevibacillus sp. JNUCC-41]